MSGRLKTGVQEVLVTLATRAGIVLSGIAIQSLLAYALLPVGRGTFAICVLVSTLLGILFCPGADVGAQHYVMTRQITVSQAVAASFGITVAGTLVAATVSIPLIASDFSPFQTIERRAFYSALLLVPLSAFGSAVRSQLAGLRRYTQLAWYSFLQTGTMGCALLLLVVWAGLGVSGAIVASCISNLVLIVACIQDLRCSHGLSCEIPSRSNLRRILTYGLRFYVARIGWGVDVRVGVLILGIVASSAEVGYFSVASGLMMQFIVISNAVFVPLLPRAATNKGSLHLVTFCSRCTIWATALMLVGFLASSHPLVQFFLSAEFLPVVHLAFIIAPGILLLAGANVLTAYFRSVNQPGICSWAVALGIATNIVFVPLLYPIIGYDAAAWSMTMGLVGRSSVLYFFYLRISAVTIGSVWIPQRGDLQRFRDLFQRAKKLPRKGDPIV